MTHDVRVPVLHAVLVDAADRALSFGLPAHGGAGCHPCREVALMRAVTEAAQSRLTTISGARDDMFVDTFKVLSSPDALEAHRKRVRGAGPRRFDDVDTWHGEAVGDDLAWVLERCRTAGFDQVVAVDLTLAQFQIPVVKVIIAGTEVTSERNMAMPGPRLRQAGRRSG